MSITARSFLYAGLWMLRLTCMYCVRVVRSVVVESRALKPCCVGDKGMCYVIVLRISLSLSLTRLYHREIDLYDVGFVWVLFGISMGMVLPFFQMCLIFLFTIVWLKMSMRAPMATCPICFKCR